MTNSNTPTAVGIVLCSGVAVLVAGCERQEPQAEVANMPLTQEVSKEVAAHTGPVASNPTEVTPDRPGSDPSAIGVDAFMQLADLPEQSVTVEGVVSAVAADAQMVALIDRQEFEQCNMLSCAKLTLPVRWEGELPDVGKTVRVRGRVQDHAGSKVFVAQSLTSSRSGMP